jgi:hypothetical protein
MMVTNLPMSWIERLGLPLEDPRESWLAPLDRGVAEQAARDADSWRPTLERLRGTIGADGIERVTTQSAFDALGVPQRYRKGGRAACSRLSKLMISIGWSAVRMRALNRGGWTERVRGYARDARRSPPTKLPR